MFQIKYHRNELHHSAAHYIPIGLEHCKQITEDFALCLEILKLSKVAKQKKKIEIAPDLFYLCSSIICKSFCAIKSGTKLLPQLVTPTMIMMFKI